MAPTDSTDRAKSPAKIRAGMAGSAARWGSSRRHLKLTELPASVRAAVEALVNAEAHAHEKRTGDR